MILVGSLAISSWQWVGTSTSPFSEIENPSGSRLHSWSLVRRCWLNSFRRSFFSANHLPSAFLWMRMLRVSWIGLWSFLLPHSGLAWQEITLWVIWEDEKTRSIVVFDLPLCHVISLGGRRRSRECWWVILISLLAYRSVDECTPPPRGVVQVEVS